MLSQYSWFGSRRTVQTIVLAFTQRGFPIILGKVSPPPTIERPAWSIGWSNSMRISRVLAGSTSIWPSSGAALTTFGGSANAELKSARTTGTPISSCFMILLPRKVNRRPDASCDGMRQSIAADVLCKGASVRHDAADREDRQQQRQRHRADDGAHEDDH